MIKNSIPRKSVSVVILLLVSSILLLLFATLPSVHAQSALVQQDNAGCSTTGCSPSPGGLSLTAAAGDVVVVTIAVYSGSVSSVSDTLGSTFSLVAEASDSPISVYIYDATLSSSGIDYIVVFFAGAIQGGVYVYEVSGVTTVGAVHEAAGGDCYSTPCSISTASTSASFQSGAFLVSMVGFPSLVSTAAGTGFTLSPGSSGGTDGGNAEYATSGVSSPTYFPFTLSSTAIPWVEMGLALAPSSSSSTTTTTSSTTTTTTSATTSTTTSTSTTQPPPTIAHVSITLNPDLTSNPIGANNYFRVSYNDGGQETGLQQGGTLQLEATIGSEVSIAGASSGSNSQEEWCLWGTSGSCNPIQFTVSTIGNTVSYTYYDLLSQSVSYAVHGGGNPNPPTMSFYTLASSASSQDNFGLSTIALSTSVQTIWALRTFSGAQPIQLSSFGVINTSPPTKNEQWAAGYAICCAITAPNVIPNPIVFDIQYQQQVSYSVSGGTGYSAPIFTYLSGGTTQQFTLGTSPFSLYVDGGSSWSANYTLTSSNPSQSWEADIGTLTTGTVTGAGTIHILYDQQLLEHVSYSTVGGAPPPNWCPQSTCNENFFYGSGGLTLSVPLSLTPTTIFADVGSTWHVVDPAFISGTPTSEAWFAIPSTSTITSGPATSSNTLISGTVSTSGSIKLVFYHEYSVAASYSDSGDKTILLSNGDAATVTLTGTQSGATAQITLYTTALPSWLDAGSSWTATSAVAISSTEQYALTSGGSGSVTAPGLTVSPLYEHQYLVAFAFSGTPKAGQSIEVNGATITPGSIWENAGATISISLTSQTAFTSWKSSTSSITLGAATSASTTATISGAGTITAVLQTNSIVDFQENGLAANALWSVTLNGQTTSSSSDVSFTMQNGATYQYTIPCVQELCPTVASGQVTLAATVSTGITVINVQFLGPWSSYLHDSQQTDQSSYVAAQAATLEWTFLAGDALSNSHQVCPAPIAGQGDYSGQCNGSSEVSSPTIGPDGTIYFADAGGSGPTLGTTNLYNGNLFALNPSGSLKWVYNTQGFIDGAAPAVSPSGTIYIETQGNPGQSSILAISPSGTLEWQIALAPNLNGVGQLSIEIAPSGTIYAPAGGVLYALAPSGLIEWQDTLSSNRIYSSPVIGPNGNIYIVGNSAKYGLTLYSINPSGTISWEVADSLAGGSLGGPAVDSNGIIYSGCNPSSICAYNPDGSLKWTSLIPTTACTFNNVPGFSQIPPGTPCTITAGPSTTLVMGPAGTLLAETEENMVESSGSATETSTSFNTLSALNSANGNAEWTVTPGTEEGFAYPPAVGADGTIYVACGFDVCAYSSTGTELWDLNTANAVGSLGPTDVHGSFGMNTAPAIGVDGTVYMGDIYGHLYAIGPGPTTGAHLIAAKIIITLHSPINILITLPNGEQAGFNANGTLVNTAGATVVAPGAGQLETISVNAPADGQYKMQIFGTGSGPFMVSTQSAASNGTVLANTSYNGTATAGSEQTTYLGVVEGGQMSMLLNVGLSNPTLQFGCTSLSVQSGGKATCMATLSGASGSIAGEQFTFSQASGNGSITLPSPALCTIVSGNSCTVIVNGVDLGNATIQASYAGDANNAGASATTNLAITIAQSSASSSSSTSFSTTSSSSSSHSQSTSSSPTTSSSSSSNFSTYAAIGAVIVVVVAVSAAMLLRRRKP